MKMRATPALKLVVVFFVFGILWILCTDAILRRLFQNDLNGYDRMQHYKGILFVLLSALLIYIVNRRLYAIVARGNRMQQAMMRELAEEKLRNKTEVVKSIIQAQETERKKIGEELHDNITQLLGVVKLYVQHLKDHPETMGELLPRCDIYLKQAIEEIRRLSRSLVPPGLQAVGLLTSLEETIDYIQQARNIRIHLVTNDFDERLLPDNKKLMLYRIVQEQLNNILKHSGANEVTIELDITGNSMRLMIMDNGRGFDPVYVKRGMGLNNIVNRLEVFNGNMEIDSAPGKGTTLVAKVPVNQ